MLLGLLGRGGAMSDWADEKAREFFAREFFADYLPSRPSKNKELAALLREVADGAKAWKMLGGTHTAEEMMRKATLAEVRRVVLTVKAETDRPGLCDEILSRLEKL